MKTLHRMRSPGLLSLALLVLLALTPVITSAATIVIVNNDGAGEGFNDPTLVAPVGGNPGTTLGAQRLYLFQYAASIWGGILPSSVVIQVRSQFNPQTCSATSAVLGSAGPISVFRDFTNAPFPGTWYHVAEANRLFGADLDLANPDINATFNSNIDAGCFGPGLVWYYGVDGNEGANIELLPVLLHEMGHGLGFSTVTSGTSGNFLSGFPSVFDHFLLDKTTGMHWNEETAAQRVASAISITNLVWDGPAVTAMVPGFLSHRPRLLVNSPGGIAGSYVANNASFGAALTLGGVTGNVVLMDDGTVPNVNDGCETLINGAAIAGNIALVDRGTCTFASKAVKAQAAGAIGLLIANNVAGPLSPGGADPSVTIPVVGISQADGATIKANLGSGVNVTIGLNPAQLAGADNLNHPFMYAPNPFQSGSSVSHWDVSLTPNALMEPAINNDLHVNVDLTTPAFDDIGWFLGATATTLSRFAAEGRSDGILLRWQFSQPEQVAAVTLERAIDPEGSWSPITTDLSFEGTTTLALDTSAEAGKTYYYRLSIMDRAGQVERIGLTSGQRTAGFNGRSYLSAAAPNPANHGTSFKFGFGRPEFVRLAVVDANGRRVRTIQEGMMAPGEYSRSWDGRTDHAGEAPVGLYFITFQTSEGRHTSRVALVR